MDRSIRRSGPRLGERMRDMLGSRGAVAALLVLILALIWLLGQWQGVPSQAMLALTVRGILLGGIIALGAIGLSLVFGVLNLPHFAHGDLMSLGAYLALFGVGLLPTGAPLRPFSFGYEFLIMLVLVIPLVGLAAFGFDRLFYRPLRRRNSSPVIMAMASLGVALVLRSLIYLFWGADFVFFYTGRPRPAFELFADIRVRPDQLFILGLALLLIFLVYLLLERSKIGKAMRATADNPELARIAGIDTERVIFWTWMIGGGLAGAGGMMYGLDTQLRPEMGWWLLLPLFAAVILGSIGNPYGALVGSLVIGIAWQLSGAFISPAYGPGVAFVIMILVLLFRPQGIFGKQGG